MPTSKGTDQAYLLDEQYKDASNLRSRIHLHRQYSVNTYGWTRWVFDYVKLSPDDARVLEIGCGPSDLWLQNLDRIPAGWEIFLSDLSPGMIEKSKDLLYDRAQRFTFQEVDVQDIPHDDNSLDTVIANHMLYHVPDLQKGLREIQRVLKPTGRLFAATNGTGHMLELRLLRAKFLQSIENEAIDGSQRQGEENEQGKGKVNSGEHWGLPFNLENGEGLLGAHFPQVILRNYVDSLRVTSARSLHDYMMSSRVHSVPPELSNAYRDFLQAEIDATGGLITIQKETGMFQAWEEDLPLPEAKHAFSFIEDDPDIKLAESPLQITVGDDDTDNNIYDDGDDDSTKVQNIELPDT